MEAEGGVPQDEVGTALSGASKVPKVMERESAAITEAQMEASEAQVQMIETLMRVTRVVTKAKGTMAKVQWVMAPPLDAGKSREARPFVI